MAKCKTDEVEACCCVDTGVLIDENDTNLHIKQVYNTEQDANNALNEIIKTAKEVYSEVVINSSVTQQDGNFTVDIALEFSCSAEVIIFQLKMR